VVAYLAFGIKQKICILLEWDLKDLKIRNLLIDERSFSFQSGINVVIGANATGKTTIFKCIKHALGLSVDIPTTFFRRLELLVTVGTSEHRFVRESGSALVHIQSEQGSVSFRARSASLDEFFQSILEPKFAVGSRLTSIFPILEFCFLSDEARLNSRSLLSVLRLICGANDKLIATASRDVQVLRSQIQAEEDFLRRNDVFVDDFLRNLGAQPPDFQESITRALATVREDIRRPLLQKLDVLQFSTVRIEELSRQNEVQFSAANREIEQTFSALLESFSDTRIGSMQLESVIARDTDGFSYGQALSADFLMFLSIARTKSFIDLNFPKVYINDGMGTRSLDSNTIKKVHNLLEAQSRDDEEFQYIEFTSNACIPSGFVVAELDK
jgi:energy-coupling factor transporter ATP-binding protein EcfA2